MKYLKTFESSWYDMIRPYLIDKYIVVKSVNNKDHFLLEVIDEMIQGKLVTNKLYTLRSDNKIKRNNHQHYTIIPAELDDVVIYKSSYIKDAYDVLVSIHDSNKYNL